MSAPLPWPSQGDGGAKARAAGLIAVAEDLACEFSLRPLLERILLRCTELLGCDAGSICSVDEAAGTYRKEADIGVACQSGWVFPLTEGMTGAVEAHRAPVRVLVAAGRPALQAGLARLLTWTEPGVEVVGEVGTARQVLEACQALRPDVALIDLGLEAGAPPPGVTGLLLRQER